MVAENCVLCDAVTRGDFCPACEKSLPHLSPHHCVVCASHMTESGICGACLANPPAFDTCVAAVNYAFPISALLHSLKYQTNLAMVPVLADLLTARIGAGALPDFIVPMPLHPVRLRERGFNQAIEIARRVSKNLGVPVLPAICRRVKNTPSQTGLPWKEREKNIRDAFACEADLSGKRIAILDDVMTTGSTLNELAKVLRKCGVIHISGWVVARTPSGDS